MDLSTWITHTQARIAALPSSAERASAWARVAHSLALADLASAPPGITTDAIWVEPAMAWTLDDLDDAGVPRRTVNLLPLAPGDEHDALAACLRRLISTLSENDPLAPLAVVDACATAAGRASTAFARLTGTLP